MWCLDDDLHVFPGELQFLCLTLLNVIIFYVRSVGRFDDFLSVLNFSIFIMFFIVVVVVLDNRSFEFKNFVDDVV